MTTPPTPPAPSALDASEAHARLAALTVIDVRTPGEYASGHLPGAHNIPLDRIGHAVTTLREVRGELLVVCASGARSESARQVLAGHGVHALSLTGGTQGWVRAGHEVHRPAGARTGWAMERQVRLTAGTLVLAGLGLGLLHPAWQLISAGVAGGLVYSALTDTCGMAALLSKLPYNRPRGPELEATLAALTQR
ncbi:rhodanese-like domain-containing protein [Streptomyces sp. NPDC001443]